MSEPAATYFDLVRAILESVEFSEEAIGQIFTSLQDLERRQHVNRQLQSQHAALIPAIRAAHLRGDREFCEQIFQTFFGLFESHFGLTAADIARALARWN